MKASPAPPDTVTLSVPRSTLTVVAPPPSHVHQGTVEAVVGLGAKAYLRLSRRGAWPVVTEGKQVLARVADVQAYLDAHAARVTPKKKGTATNDEQPSFDEMPLPAGVRHAS